MAARTFRRLDSRQGYAFASEKNFFEFPERSKMSEPFFQKIKNALATGPISRELSQKPDLASARFFSSQMTSADAWNLFCSRCVMSGSVTHQPATIDQLVETIRQIIPTGSSILIDPTLALAPQLSEKLGDHYTPISLDRADDTQLFSAHSAITAVDFAIAETGSAVITNHPHRPRLASLVVETHIALIRPEQILPDLMDLADRLTANEKENFPAGLTIISGPSKTSDIEMKLVVGVHGPAQMHMILLPEKND